MPQYEILPGKPHPLGATPGAGGVNFSVFSRHATAVELLLFDEHDNPTPGQVIALNPRTHKTFHFWHVHVVGLKPGMHYAYRVDGPGDIHQGHRFNRNKVLSDPYARGNTNNLWDRVKACGPDDNLASSLRSVVMDSKDYDWEGDRPLEKPMQDTIIYEMHVGGFTRHQSSGVRNPGTFQGVIEKIPYLKSLGITAVELLPVFEFDETEILRVMPDGKCLTNYWGYSTVSFFAPHRAYCVSPEDGTHLREFRDMVKALHRAGIEVILDVVFNHTSEGNHQGPTINFRGFDNSTYYYLVVGNRQYYMDFSGCGNTVNCNHPIAGKFITDCLEFWSKEMHVDGFRFDEGSILSRGEDGVPMRHSPVLWDLELSETFAQTKLIAEAWDAAGLYQIGQFPGYRWAEWNGKFRDDVRRFVRGDPGLVGMVASRIAGSADLYESSGHQPINSINFITCHDGFTLNDLVSYNEKHNWANGEGNKDGINENLSWNCGAEGESSDEGVERLRAKQIRNFAAILLLSRGVPMIDFGDEVGRTQSGNNNAYCQDNPIGWFDWSQPEKHADLLRFFRLMIDFRKRHEVLRQPAFYTSEENLRGLPEITWHGCQLNSPGWNDPACRVLAFTVGGPGENPDIHVMMNMYWEPLSFEIPSVKGIQWHRSVDTSLDSPLDIAEPGAEELIAGGKYTVNGRSIVTLISKN